MSVPQSYTPTLTMLLQAIDNVTGLQAVRVSAGNMTSGNPGSVAYESIGVSTSPFIVSGATPLNGLYVRNVDLIQVLTLAFTVGASVREVATLAPGAVFLYFDPTVSNQGPANVQLNMATASGYVEVLYWI